MVLNHTTSYYAKIAKLENNKEKLKNKVIDSKSYLKLNNIIKKQENNITNRRLDWLHKVSKYLVQQYNTISFEDFSSKEFVEENNIRYLNKQVMSGSFGTLKTLLAYKANAYEKKFKLIDPEYTSQICSKCLSISKKGLAERVHKCTCGLCIDRDVNSAINILLISSNDSFKDSFEKIVDKTKASKKDLLEPRNGLASSKAAGLNKIANSNLLDKSEAQGL